MIERQTINGKPAAVQYLNEDFMPATKEDHRYARVVFEEGEVLLLINEQLQGGSAPGTVST